MITWQFFLHYWPFVRGIKRDSYEALTNSQVWSDLRCHDAHVTSLYNALLYFSGLRAQIGALLKRTSYHPGCCRVRDMLSTGKRSGLGGIKAPVINFSIKEIFISWKYLLRSLNHFHIWQMSPQLSCGDSCQKWMWQSTGNQWFDNW